jgi:hypothetical protein
VNRAFAAVVSVALVGATLEPLVRSPGDDGFPLSTYPMFAVPRESRVTLSYAYGTTASGERRTLSPDALGTREVLQALVTVELAVARGPSAALPLCSDIAHYVRNSDIAIVHIATATFDALAYFTDDARTGTDEVEHARCEVRR